MDAHTGEALPRRKEEDHLHSSLWKKAARSGRGGKPFLKVDNSGLTCELNLKRVDVCQVHKYLQITGQQLEIDMFNFDWWVQVHTCELVPVFNSSLFTGVTDI